MDLSVSLCIAASFAILCTFYIGKSILVMDFSEKALSAIDTTTYELLLYETISGITILPETGLSCSIIVASPLYKKYFIPSIVAISCE